MTGSRFIGRCLGCGRKVEDREYVMTENGFGAYDRRTTCCNGRIEHFSAAPWVITSQRAAAERFKL